ncbi:MAG TPA: galactokinase [Anaerolineae bacterium]|nr:galactokinase [Anaerolineae bacterium]HQI83175.1 galactokinase [Anaerolineae bacterium]
MAEHELYKKVTQAYTARFQQPPQLVVRAPGRVNLIGEHTDYNDGFVLPVAVDQAAWLAVGPAEEPLTTIRAIDMNNDETVFAVTEVPASVGGWPDYPKGVVWAYLERGLQPTPINAVLASDVPVAAGMSSSAALELAFAFAWNTFGQFDIALSDLALLCQRAENQYVGVNCGIMDQMISACGKAGHAMMLDSRSLDRRYFPMPEGVAVVVADSLVRRSLASSEYNVRRAQCEQAVTHLQAHVPEVKALRDVSLRNLERFGRSLPDVVYRRARHVVTENDRVLRFARALYTGDIDTAGGLMVEGHRSLRDDYEVSAPELDVLVEAAVEVPGCYGARLTGAGFGGCTIALVAEEVVPEFQAHIAEVYDARFGKRPAVYVTHPADGVAVIQ